jgi:hypothetical protein
MKFYRDISDIIGWILFFTMIHRTLTRAHAQKAKANI